MQRRFGRKESIGLILLFVLFLFSAVYYERKGQEVTPNESPSSLNAKTKGVKALYLLLETQGYHVGRLEAPWSSLSPQDGLVVLVEPFERGTELREVAALKRWVERGGTVLFLVTKPARPLDPKDPLFGDVAIIKGNAEAADVEVEEIDSPFLQDVADLHIQSPVRLQPSPVAPYQTLAKDADGALLLTKTLGKGTLLILASSEAANNSFLKEADNAIFLVNVAEWATQHAHARVAFDEYHHGIGYARGDGESEGSWFQALPVALQLACWHLVGLGLLILYNGNRRFGALQTVPVAGSPSRGDYVRAMARVFHKAHATEIAIQTLYSHFLRDLARHLNAPVEMGAERLSTLAASQCGVDAEPLRQTLMRCEQISAGERVTESEMLRLTQQITHYRRRCHLVGT